MSKGWDTIGKIGKPRGLRGEFYLADRQSPLPPEYVSHQVVVGHDPDSGFLTSIETNKLYNERSLIKLKDIDDRTQIEHLYGQLLWSTLHVAEHSWAHLIGRAVSDKEGKLMGVVKEFYNFGGVDNVEILDTTSQQLVQIPFVPSFFDWENIDKSSNEVMLLVSSDVFSEFWYSA